MVDSLEKTARPLNRREYVFDIITELTKLKNEFYLIFKRILWNFPLKFDSKLYIDMIYNQVMPDFIDGLLIETDNDKLTQESNKMTVKCPKIYSFTVLSL